MYSDFLNILLAFLEGFALIISPCILPVLPIILAGSLEKGRKRPLGIVIGFITAFTLFTVSSRQIVRYFDIDLTSIRYFSFILLFLFGLIMISSYLSEKFSRLTQGAGNLGLALTEKSHQQEGFFQGIVFGALIGLIWTPCAGPILAAVIVQTVIQKTTWASYLTILAFSIGTALPMLLIALLGKTIINKLHFFKKHADILRKLLGWIIIISVLLMVYGEFFPLFSQSNLSTGFLKSTDTSQQQLSQNLNLKNDKSGYEPIQLINGISPYKAPEIAGITAWINSHPLDMKQLKGKVVLIDFWAYSCINCIRTFPYLKDWYSKYHDKGFEIIGIHSPEFDFEKKLENVQAAVTHNDIHYPVALDNEFVTWRNYNNLYWPAHYLINQQGDVVYTHFGEGEYTITENNIRYLLGLNQKNTPTKQEEHIPSLQTPETYLGYERMEHNASPETIIYNKASVYTFPKELKVNQWSLDGKWNIQSKKIIAAEANVRLEIHFYARNVFIVMGNPTASPIAIKLLLNGKAIGKNNGKDVTDSTIFVKEHKLYDVLALDKAQSGILELIVQSPGVEIYTFTFGN